MVPYADMVPLLITQDSLNEPFSNCILDHESLFLFDIFRLFAFVNMN